MNLKGFLMLFFCVISAFAFAQQNSKSDTLSANSVVILDEVVVSASRLKELLLRSPVAIEKLDKSFFNNSGAPSFFDALNNVKGVYIITPSLGFKVLNTRGFSNTTNVRFSQLVDGMDIQSPHIGSPIGNALGPSDLDIGHVEIVPGIAAALYGMNSINGLADFTTKNPFMHQGLSVQQRTALSHFNNSNSGVQIFSETSLRYAKALSKNFAFKINGTFTKGNDWIADNYTDLNGQANASTGLLGDANPAKDPVNGYGNESANRRTLTLQGKNYVVARTGYFEKDVVDYSMQNIKADATLIYKTKAGGQLSYQGKIAFLDNVYQRANRFRLENYLLHQQGLDYKSKAVNARLYFNQENTGDSYNLRSIAENIDRDFKSDNKWFQDYTTSFNSSFTGGQSVANSHTMARTAADAGRYLPGTLAYDAVLNKLQNINNWDSGAALRVKAGFIHAEAQWNLTESFLKKWKENAGLELLAGIDHRTFIIKPDGNYFINPEAGKQNSNINYSRSGIFISGAKTFFYKKIKLTATVRADKNDYFKLLVNPRFTAVYSPALRHNFRMSFQSGYRYPIIFEAYSNVNSGGVKRVGGLPVMSNGIFENAWLQSSISNFQAAVLNDVNTLGITRNAAIEKNKKLLQKNPYTYIQPERVQSIEFGYKALLMKDKLFFDADLYFNRYKSFIAQANMNVPNTSNPDSIPYALMETGKQARYRMWTNSQTNVFTYGLSAGLRYKFGKGFVANGNINYSKLRQSEQQDGLEDGFNTPAWIINAGLANPNVYMGFGAGLAVRWQSKFYWQSFLINGDVPAYYSLDGQINYTFKNEKLNIKIGGNNLLNTYYYSYLGGPSIGGFYYCTISFGLNN